MKQTFKLTSILFLSFFLIAIQGLKAQTKDDIFNTLTDVTWLGLDFSQAKIFGTAYQFGNAGEITNSQLVDKYIPEWNQLFINEMKKYDVAGAIHRTTVKYYLDATAKVNNNIKKDFFITNNVTDIKPLDEKKIAEIVKTYDFQKSDGIGLMFIVDEMDKAKTLLTAWVTFVNIKTKTVLFTVKETGRIGGFGFRNYWAGGFYSILKNIKSNFYRWNR